MKKTILFIAMLLVNHFIFAAAQNDEITEAMVLKYINEYRTQHHLKPLQMNSTISQQARKHSKEMATHTVPFGHEGFKDRIAILYKQVKEPRGGAENVAYNYKSAQDVVYNWVRSPGHKQNIVGNYNLTGIGIVRDSKGKMYFTQIFLRAAVTPDTKNVSN